MQIRNALLLALFSTAVVSQAAPSIATSVRGRAAYDSNVFLQDAAPLAVGQTSYALPTREGTTVLSALASISARWRTADGALTTELGYSPEAFRYLAQHTENHVDHTLTAALADTKGPLTGEVKVRYLYVDGAEDAPIFSGLGGTPAIGGEPVRARRTQAVVRSAGKLAWQNANTLVRGVFSSFDQQFHTRESSTPGYCNYADRDESWIGVETGVRTRGSLWIVGGVRTGFQRQANVLGVPLNYTNTFTRWLIGVEGSVGPTLKLSVLAGPDIHHFGESVRAGFDREQRTGYGEASASWMPTKTDTVTLTGKQYLWFSSAGRGAYFDTLVDLTYKRTLTPLWSVGAGANYHEGNTSHLNPWSPRHDKIYTGTVTVGRTLGRATRCDLEIMHDWSSSLVPNTPAREYSRWITSVGITRNW